MAVVIEVGGAGGAAVYTPNQVSAPNGTIVTFQFSGSRGNYTVTQSSLEKPCEPLPKGFDSGWVFFNGSTFAAEPMWNITITNDQAPIWFYCKQLGLAGQEPHCEEGMIGVINFIGTQPFASFSVNAAATTVVGQLQGGLSGVNTFATEAVVGKGTLFTGAPASPTTASNSTFSGSTTTTPSVLTLLASPVSSAFLPPSTSVSAPPNPQKLSTAILLLATVISILVIIMAGLAAALMLQRRGISPLDKSESLQNARVDQYWFQPFRSRLRHRKGEDDLGRMIQSASDAPPSYCSRLPNGTIQK